MKDVPIEVTSLNGDRSTDFRLVYPERKPLPTAVILPSMVSISCIWDTVVSG